MDRGKFTSALIGLCGTLIGGWSVGMRILLVLMLADIVTGVIKGLKFNSYQSRLFREGILNKVGFFIVIIIGYQADLLLYNNEPVIRDILIIFYTGVEGSSILENLGQIGVPVPNILVGHFKVFQDRGNNAEINTEKNKNKK